MATPAQTALSNQSLTFEVFDDGEKLTIAEVAERVNLKLKASNQTSLSDRTIRRAMQSLIRSGFIKEFGRQNNAMLYGKVSTSWADSSDDPNANKLIPLAGKLVSVTEFLELVADEQANP